MHPAQLAFIVLALLILMVTGILPAMIALLMVGALWFCMIVFFLVLWVAAILIAFWWLWALMLVAWGVYLVIRRMESP